jgi:hypothetical protein
MSDSRQLPSFPDDVISSVRSLRQGLLSLSDYVVKERESLERIHSELVKEQEEDIDLSRVTMLVDLVEVLSPKEKEAFARLLAGGGGILVSVEWLSALCAAFIHESEQTALHSLRLLHKHRTPRERKAKRDDLIVEMIDVQKKKPKEVARDLKLKPAAVRMAYKRRKEKLADEQKHLLQKKL